MLDQNEIFSGQDVKMKKWIMWMVAMYGIVGMFVGCASSKSASSDTESAMEEQVMYSPPAENEPVEIPPGGPVLEEYATPSSKVEDSEAPSDVAEGSLQVQREDLDALLAKGPGWGLVHVKVAPVKDESGKLMAYEVSALTEEASVWLSPALQVGDQITHLNGVRIQTPDDYMKAWNLSKSVTELRIDYVRAGTPSASSWIVVDE